jgi:hypothetical protein
MNYIDYIVTLQWHNFKQKEMIKMKWTNFILKSFIII